MRAVRMKTSDLTRPVGIDIAAPRFTWNAEGGIRQTAYQLLVKKEDGELLYDSGKVPGDHMYCVYAGRPPKSREKLFWQVGLWDEHEENGPDWSDWEPFEMGLLAPSDWQAEWICGKDTDREERLPADYFRKTFCVGKKLKSARLYASALGMYSARLNGKRVTTPLAPGSTQADKRLYYQTFDVTKALKEGRENELILTLGDGWYKGKVGADQTEYFFGTGTALTARLELQYEDGTAEAVVTDESFLWTDDGPIRFADLKDGEIWDERKCIRQDASDRFSLREDAFRQHAVRYQGQVPLMTAQNSPYITEHETFRPVLLTSPSGASILDFGQNLAGYVRFLCRIPEGKEIRLRLFEALDHGEYCDTSLSFPENPAVATVKQEIVFTGSGQEALFQPEFFYSGFRYALVEGMEEIHPEAFEAVAVYSDLDYAGDFDCSSPDIVQFLKNTRWSMKSNFIDVPTDCPQREKSGWTGDAQVFCSTAAFFADTKAFFRKWLRDVRDCQQPDGLVWDVNPMCSRPGNPHAAINGAVGWADAAVIIPYTLWKLSGDSSFITDNYELMHDFAAQRMAACADKSILNAPDDSPLAQLKPLYQAFRLEDSEWKNYVLESGIHWGEWCVPLSQEPLVTGDSVTDLLMPKPEVGTAYTAYSLRLLAEMAEAVGKTEDAARYHAFSENAVKAYRYYWVKDGEIHTNRMAELVRPLALGLLTKEEERDAAAKLNEMAVSRGYKVGTGFLSTPFVLQVLASHGYADTAYRMLENTEAPGWLAMVKKGATTVWESYECYDAKDHVLPYSFNHYSPGAVCSYLFDTVCGIRVTGENHVTIQPCPGGSLTYASASVMTFYGKVESSWKISDDTDDGRKLTFSVSVPANMTAELILPDGTVHSLTAGTFSYCSSLEE